MTIVAFDCCLHTTSVTILSNGKMTTRRESADKGGPAERLLPLIEEARTAAGCEWSDVERLAVTLGPGGFTSVRVGIAAARALALACNIPAVGISTLELLAWTALDQIQVPRQHPLLVTIPAGKGGLYAQSFDAAMTPLTPARVVEADALATLLEADAVLIGPGTAVLMASQKRPTDTAEATMAMLEPSTESLARRAAVLTMTEELRPIYLRAADAKPPTGKGLERT